MTESEAASRPTGPPLGDVILAVPRGVGGPVPTDRPMSPIGRLFAVFSVHHQAWLTDVVGLQLRTGTSPPFPEDIEVILTRLTCHGTPLGDLPPGRHHDGGVNERYRVIGFTVDENAPMRRGVLTAVCTCPTVSGGLVRHQADCSMRRVTSDGR